MKRPVFARADVGVVVLTVLPWCSQPAKCRECSHLRVRDEVCPFDIIRVPQTRVSDIAEGIRRIPDVPALVALGSVIFPRDVYFLHLVGQRCKREAGKDACAVKEWRTRGGGRIAAPGAAGIADHAVRDIRS